MPATAPLQPAPLHTGGPQVGGGRGEPGGDDLETERDRVDRIGGKGVVPGGGEQPAGCGDGVPVGCVRRDAGERRAQRDAHPQPLRRDQLVGAAAASTAKPTAASATVVASIPCSARPNQSSAPSW